MDHSVLISPLGESEQTDVGRYNMMAAGKSPLGLLAPAIPFEFS